MATQTSLCATEENYKMLAMAIVESAVDEYLRLGAVAMARGQETFDTDVGLRRLRKFFRSNYGECLIGFGGGTEHGLTGQDVIDVLDSRICKKLQKRKYC